MLRLALKLLMLVLLALPATARQEQDMELRSNMSAELDWTEWRVRNVSCSGLVHADSVVILRELELQPGTGYSDALLQEDALAVKNTGLFARLVISVEADTSDESVDINYAVTERPRFLAYPIVSPTEDLEWVYGFGLMNRNLGGKGRRLDLEAEYGNHLNYSLQLVEPWIFGVRNPLSIYLNRRIADNATGDYERRSSEIVLGYRHYFDKELSLGLNPWWHEVVIHDEGAEDPYTVNPQGRDTFGGFTFDLNHNTTDLHVYPERGGRSHLMVSAFGLGGRNQPAGTRVWASRSRFRSLGSGRVLGVNLAAETTAGRIGDYFKHYLGGRNGVRSGHSGDWPGGSLLYGNLELRLPLMDRRVYFKRIDIALGAVFFADGGVVWKERFHGDQLAAGAVGLGLRVFAPFIDVGRLDLAWSLERGAVIQIGKGHSF
jgi:outer membrane protein assembly factor BamA